MPNPPSAIAGTYPTPVDWAGSWATVDWAAVDWAAVDWAAIDWAAVDWAAFDWTALDYSPSDWTALPTRAASAATHPAAGRWPITVQAINEPQPGTEWKALFDTTWPAYRAWYLAGPGQRPSLAAAIAMLQLHMPELLPTYRRLVELSGDDEVAARMLTMWNAPAFLPACSQAVLTGPTPALCRNYDYSPALWEQTIYTSEFTGRRVIGTGDCLWGLLDGMNDAGLAVSLTFGGRPGSGVGFAIPLVIRYLLEVADTADQAKQLLVGLPIAMSYNLAVIDAAGHAFTAFVAPGQEPEFSEAAVSTNHHGAVPEFPERAAALQSVPRLDRLADVVASGPTPDQLTAAFLTQPLYNTDYRRAFGTLYTALYRPAEKVVEYHWPDVIWRRGFDDPSEARRIVLNQE